MPHHDAWLRHRQSRWLRPDADRWVRADASRFLVPGSRIVDAFPALARKYNPNQPRVPAGSPDGGQWTDGSSGQRPRVVIDTTNLDSDESGDSDSVFGGGTGPLNLFDITPQDAAIDGVQLAGDEGGNRRIDLMEERDLGGHAMAHVGRSAQSLLSELRDTLASARRKGDFGGGLREGSFPSLEAANKLVNSTIARNSAIVSLVASGVVPRANLDADFPSPTGMEAFAATERSQPYVRDTYGVRVVIVPDGRSSKGYRVETAFPRNRGR